MIFVDWAPSHPNGATDQHTFTGLVGANGVCGDGSQLVYVDTDNWHDTVLQ